MRTHTQFSRNNFSSLLVLSDLYCLSHSGYLYLAQKLVVIPTKISLFVSFIPAYGRACAALITIRFKDGSVFIGLFSPLLPSGK